jgi:light-regulated signal transduction histidine kinase (bacteriophytochrome)
MPEKPIKSAVRGSRGNDQDFRALIDDLTSVNEELQHSAYALAHDLQAPLRAIATFTHLLKDRIRGNLDDESVHMFDFVFSSVERMKLLIQGMLELAEINKRADVANVQVETLAAVQLALRDLEPAIEATGAKICIDTLPTVYGNPDQILRLFENLIGNAIKYRGDNTPEIRISASSRKDAWVFSIEDNGIGIDSRYHIRIFDMFQRLHSASKYEGSGVGLAACKMIVQRHNGQIWVESQPGRGSTFYFSIPADSQTVSRESSDSGIERKLTMKSDPSSFKSRTTESGR